MDSTTSGDSVPIKPTFPKLSRVARRALRQIIEPARHKRGERTFPTTFGAELDGKRLDEIPDMRWERDLRLTFHGV